MQQFVMTGMQLAGLSLLYSMLSSELEGEEYEKLDPTIKDRRFLLGNGAHITLRPDLFTYMFKIMPEHILQNMYYESEDNRKTIDSLKKSLGDVALFNVLPQAIRPAISLLYNYDPLTGRSVVPQSVEGRVSARQVTGGTSELAKLLAGDNISPVKVDYFLRQYFGYTGGLITMFANEIIEDAKVFNYDRPTKSDRDKLASIPGMSAFISKEYGNRHTSDYYQFKADVRKVVKAYKDLEKYSFSPKKAKKYAMDNFNVFAFDGQMNVMENQIGRIRQQRNEVLMMPRNRMNADQKKEFLDKLYKIERGLLTQIREMRKASYGTNFKKSDLYNMRD